MDCDLGKQYSPPQALALPNIEYSYQSPGSIQWFTFREEHNLNISLSKTFLNEKLQVKLAGEHLLNRRMSLYDGRINNIYFWQNEEPGPATCFFKCGLPFQQLFKEI